MTRLSGHDTSVFLRIGLAPYIQTHTHPVRMRRIPLTLVLALAIPLTARAQAPQPRDLVLNEIAYDPPPAQGADNEWVELYNRSDRTFDLGRFAFADAVTAVDLPADAGLIAPGAYAVLVNDAALFEEAYPGVPFVEVPGFPALNNGGDTLTLLFEGAVIDEVPYDDAWGGADASLERIDPAGPSASASNWATTLHPDGGTPGAQNSQFMEDTVGPRIVAVAVAGGGGALLVTFDEPLDPATVGAGAFALSAEGGGPVPPVTAAAYLGDGPPTVRVTLGEPLAAGAYLLEPRLLTDLLGNVTPGAPFAFEHAPDVTPPALAAAFAADPLTVVVAFSEPVTAETAGDPASYRIDGGIGPPEAVAFPLVGDSARAALSLAAPLQERVPYTLTVSGIADADGNVLDGATAPLFLGAGDVPAPGDLVINEVMFDPANGGAGEYVEVLNRTGRLFLLSELVLTDDPAAGGEPVSPVPVVVPPGGLAVVVADRDSFAVRFPEAPPPVIEAGAFPSLNNDGDTVALLHLGTVVDAVTYDPGWHRVELEDATGVALERVDPAGPSSSRQSWSSSLDPRGGTPGEPNTVFVAPGTPPGETGLTVDSPFDPDAGQRTAIRFTLETEAALIRVRIFDGAGRLVRHLEEGEFVGREGAVLWDGRGEDGRPLRIGPYVVLLEAVDVEGGATEAHRATVVLARQF